MTTKTKRVVLHRVEGGYIATHAGHTYHVFRERTEYGDIQWLADRDDAPGYAMCDTLAGARATIAAD